jgi:hypothetical protein
MGPGQECASPDDPLSILPSPIVAMGLEIDKRLAVVGSWIALVGGAKATLRWPPLSSLRIPLDRPRYRRLTPAGSACREDGPAGRLGGSISFARGCVLESREAALFCGSPFEDFRDLIWPPRHAACLLRFTEFAHIGTAIPSTAQAPQMHQDAPTALPAYASQSNFSIRDRAAHPHVGGFW